MTDRILVQDRNYRSATLQKRQREEGADGPDLYDMTFSTGAKVLRYDYKDWYSPGEPYYEVLSQKAEDVDTTRMDLGALPLLRDHNGWSVDSVIGSVEGMEFEDGRGRAVVSFDESDEENQKIKRKVDNGVLRNVSVGYSLDNAEVEEIPGEGRDDPPTRIFRNWSPTEISLVAVGADPNAGIGRSNDQRQRPVSLAVINRSGSDTRNDSQTTEDRQMPDTTPPTGTRSEPTGQASAAPAVVTADADEMTARVAAADELDKWSRTYEDVGGDKIAAEIRREFPDYRVWADKFRERVAAAQRERYENGPQPPEDASGTIGMSEREAEGFSLRRAMIVAGSESGEMGFSRADIDTYGCGFEQEAMTAARQQIQKDNLRTLSGNFTIPQDVLDRRFRVPRIGRSHPMAGMMSRDLTVTMTGGDNSNDVSNVVADNLLVGSFIEAVRHYSAVIDRVQVLDGLVGNIEISIQDGVASVTWNGETAATDMRDSDISLDQRQARPKNMGISTKITRQSLIQATPAMDMLVERDATLQAALALDIAILDGSGSSNQPRGVRNTTGIGSVVAAPTTANAGGKATHGVTVDLETQVDQDNSLVGDLAYVTRSPVNGQMKKEIKGGAGSGRFVSEGGIVNDYPLLKSNQLPANVAKGTSANNTPILFGDWMQVILCMWSGLDMIFDPYTLAGRRLARFFFYQDVDLVIRHPESFAVCNDINPALA